MTSLSHSGLQTLQQCPLKYYLSRIQGIERKGTSKGLRRGAAFSDAMEHRNVAKIHEAYAKHIMDANTQAYIDDLLAEEQIVAALYRHHEVAFHDDEREIEFDEPIGQSCYRNRGRIDGVTYRDMDGQRVIDELSEDKLLARWTGPDEAALPLNGQVLRYMNATPTASKIVYRVTPYPNTYKRKDESAKAYADRVTTEVAKKVKKGDYFKVFELTREQLADAMRRYDEDLVKRAAEVEWRTATDNWPGAYGEACKAFGGCEFLPACKREPGYEGYYQQKEERE